MIRPAVFALAVPALIGLAAVVPVPATAGLPQRPLSGVVSHVADGDTLDVSVGGRVSAGDPAGGRTVTVRLEGIDAPEGGQPFSVEARRHLRVVAFGQRVTVVPSDTDRYGRLVGRVLVGADDRGRGGKDASEEMLRAGLAWHFRRYSSDTRLAQLEAAARARRAGLWSDPSAIPPWTWRNRERPRRPGSPGSPSPRSTAPGSGSPGSTFPGAGPHRGSAGGRPPVATAAAPGPYRGNVSSGVYHAPSCRDYRCKHCTSVFASREDAESAGFHPHRECVFPRKQKGGCPPATRAVSLPTTTD